MRKNSHSKLEVMPVDELLKQISIVFDDNFNIKACGRQECKKLIKLLQEKCSLINFGNAETGFINIEPTVVFIKEFLKNCEDRNEN